MPCFVTAAGGGNNATTTKDRELHQLSNMTMRQELDNDNIESFIVTSDQIDNVIEICKCHLQDSTCMHSLHARIHTGLYFTTMVYSRFLIFAM